MLPIWVEIPFRSLALEGTKHKLAHSLEEVLVYIRGSERSLDPNEKACILWDLRGDFVEHPSPSLHNDIDLAASHI